jgi:hypothetical protein
MRTRRAAGSHPWSLRRAGASLALAAALALPLGGCGDDGTGPDADASSLVVSGTLTGPELATLPEGARVVVLWEVASGEPDYGYAFGSGTIDRANGRFTLTLPERPPEDALNAVGSYRLGVGTIVVVAPGTTIPQGRVELGAFPVSAVLGAAARYGVIYTGGNAASAPAGWWRTFPVGYAVGRGIAREEAFDEFERVDATAVEIIVDDPNNLEFVNWT